MLNQVSTRPSKKRSFGGKKVISEECVRNFYLRPVVFNNLSVEIRRF